MTFKNPTRRPVFAVMVATLGGLLLTPPAQASPFPPATFTIDDTLGDDHVQVTSTGDFRNIVFSANCAGVGTQTCSETLPVDSQADFFGHFPGSEPNLIEINIWENFVNGLLSDTFLAKKTPTPNYATTGLVHGEFLFQSDVTGTRLTPYTGSEPGAPLLFNVVEDGFPIKFTLGPHDSVSGLCTDATNICINLTITSDAPEVPEPASLLLLGTGLVVGAYTWRKRTRVTQ